MATTKKTETAGIINPVPELGFNPNIYEELRQNLISRPGLVLSFFKSRGIDFLSELLVYWDDVRHKDKDKADVIRRVARSMGIPEHP